MTKISILSAVFNEENYISEMIDSVLRQTHQDFELIFVDDASNDKTVDIIKSYASIDPRIKLVSRGIKLGKVAAFNLAFEKSAGDCIILLAGDDVLPPDSLEVRARHVNPDNIPQHETAIAYFKLKMFSQVKKFDGLVVPRGNKANRSGGTFIMNRALANMLFPIDIRLATEDIWLATLAEMLSAKFIEVPYVVLDYRIHQGNSNPRHLNFKEMNVALNRRFKTYEYLIESKANILSPDQVRRLARLSLLEEYRFEGNIRKLIAGEGVSIKQRMFLIFHSTPILFYIRQRLFKLFSGW